MYRHTFLHMFFQNILPSKLAMMPCFQLQGISLDCAFPDIWPMVWLKAPWIQHLFWENENEITPKYTEGRVVGLFDPPCFRKCKLIIYDQPFTRVIALNLGMQTQVEEMDDFDSDMGCHS